MSRRMSCSLTIDAVRNRTKTVTRRHVDTWRTLKPGDCLTLVEKAMGLPKGARQVVIADVVIVAVDVVPLVGITDPEIWTPAAWAGWWALSHGYRTTTGVAVRRIEWRYLT